MCRDTGKKLVRGAEVWKESGQGYTRRPQREGHLRTWKKSKEQGTHCLETAGGRGQGTERRKLSDSTHEGGTLGNLWMSVNRQAVCMNSVWWRDLQYTTRNHTLKVLNP